jgi:two-component system response regulator YesN
MKGNLLLIDDEELLLEILQFSLNKFADNIFVASNGIDGLAVLKSEDIHCVVCDITMPRMTGVEVLKSMREMNNDTPFIFYTGNGNRTLMKEAGKYGALDFLNKPSLDGLEEAVAKGLKRGLNPGDTPEVTTKFISEYSQLLEELESRKNLKAN